MKAPENSVKNLKGVGPAKAAAYEKLGIRTTLQEMHIPLDREYLQAMLTETVTGPDMEHIPYPVTEDMIFEAMKVVENL